MLGGIKDLSPWPDEMGSLGNRHVAVGGTLDELQARFNEARTPLGGRFYFSRPGPL